MANPAHPQATALYLCSIYTIYKKGAKNLQYILEYTN